MRAERQMVQTCLGCDRTVICWVRRGLCCSVEQLDGVKRSKNGGSDHLWGTTLMQESEGGSRTWVVVLEATKKDLDSECPLEVERT